ncbi:CBS domain-containing protein [Nocardiopsis chromatogenes]|uniref:CBS domain-containing protein n=1 Tax=Nocardiopsis chromatogenes TaxID=280239 RepID=UPI0003482904|nr:CBS domain-containing protein [Nocardiopsis chromatogenes]
MAATVRDVMSAPPHTAAPDTTLAEIARTMRDEDIGDVLIVEGDRLRGLVTDRDLAVRCVAEGADCSTATVADAFTAPTVSIAPEEHVNNAVRLMREHSIRRLPVVEQGRPLGVVSLGDLALERDPRSVLADISAADGSDV